MVGGKNLKCKRCGASWILGNLSLKRDCCPICDINLNVQSEYREYETVIELLQVLIEQNGIDFWNNDRAINGYLNDYFPEKIEIRDKIRFLLDNKFNNQIIYWYHNPPSRDEIMNALEGEHAGNMADNQFIDGIMALVETYKNEGTNFENPSFYKEYAQKCVNMKFKEVALEKAVQCGADEQTELELAEFKLAVGEKDGIDILQRLAEKDNVNSLLRLAKMYEQGKFINRDYSKEIECLNKAISKNSAEGMFQLGRLYMLGWGMPKSKEKAVELFEKASEYNHEKANYQLYSVYYNENREQIALEKLKHAADSGYVPAMYEYALHLLYGEHITENVSTAVSILNACALQGNTEAIEKLRYIYSVGYKVPQDKLKALEWQEKLKGG